MTTIDNTSQEFIFKERVRNGLTTLVAIDGLDGCGKGTIREELSKKFVELGYRVVGIDFPYYETRGGRLLKHLLKEDDEGLSLQERMAVYALNRLECLESIIAESVRRESPSILLFDRFPTSNILTIAYYLAKNNFRDVNVNEIEGKLNQNYEKIKKLFNLIDEVDNRFISTLNLYNAFLFIPVINPEISIKRIENDDTRDGKDLYEEKKVQTIAHILYKLFKDQHNHRFNLKIIEQNNRNAEEISNEIIQILELIRYEHFGERIDIKINNHSQLYGKFIDEILIDYPRLKSLYSKY